MSVRKRSRVSVPLLSCIALVFSSAIFDAQTPSPSSGRVAAGAGESFIVNDGTSLKKEKFTFAAEVVNETFTSRLMSREMPYRVILPAAYKNDPAGRFPVIYLLHGLGGHFNNWSEKTKLVDYVTLENFIVVTPEGNDGWYIDSATKPDDKYETYIVQELIPTVDKKFRTIGDREHRAIAGLSMGGYGSIKFGLKYPDTFAVVGSFSGTLYGPMINPADPPADVGKSVAAVFGPLTTEMKKANDVFDLVQQTPADKIKKLPFFYFDCGTEDRYFKSNRDFASVLLEKKVPHEFRELPGNHSWKYWGTQVEEFFRVAGRFITIKK